MENEDQYAKHKISIAKQIEKHYVILLNKKSIMSMS